MANQQPIQSGYVQAPLLRFHRDNPLRLTVTVDASFPLTTMDVRFVLQPKGMPIRKQWIAGEAGDSLTVAGQVITLLAEPDSASDTDANFDLSAIQALGAASWELSIRGDISNVPKGIVIVGDMEWIAIGTEDESGPNAAISNPDIALDIVDEELTLTITGGGEDGREVELRSNAGRLEWRYVGDPTWIDLGLIGNAAHASSHVTGGADKIRNATASQDGLMTSAYASKLDGIEAGANNYSLPAPTTTALGGVKRNTGTAGQFVTGIDTDGSLLRGTPAGSGTVTSIAISGSDGIEIDSGSPITTTGTIALGVNASTLKTHIGLNNVENTALSTFAGSANITTLGTIATGTVPVANVSGLGTAATTSSTDYAPALGPDDNYVTDAEKTVIGNTSGTNTGDNAVNSLYSGLVTNATHTGDVTGETALTISNDAVTFAKMQNISSDHLIGRHSSGNGDPQQIGLGGGIEIHGGNLRRSALTGDVTAAAGDNATTIANGAVTEAKCNASINASLDLADSSIQPGNAALSDARTPTAHSHEGTSILSTGETGGTKFLREDGDGTSSWQPIAGGGDALVGNPLSQFAATSSSQLAGVISDETGTGSLVFANSPTLVTPALGTPASGVLTNCTGLPEAGLADDAVTLAKMAAGTAGNLITYDAGGNPAVVATGTATHVLTSNGAGAAPTFQAAAGGGLTNLSETLYTASPNNTVNAVKLAVTGGTTNGDAVIQPKGTGAFILGPQPDGTGTGGNKRGARAVDLNMLRNGGTQVASGDESLLFGGFSTSSAQRSITMGYACANSAAYGVNLGYLNASSGGYNVTIGANCNNSCSQPAAVIGSGSTNTANHATVLGLLAANIRNAGFVIGAGRFGANGDCQFAMAILRATTSNATPTELFLEEGARFTIPASGIIAGTISLVGTRTDGSAIAHYVRQVCLKNVSGTTSEVYSPATIGTDNAAGTSIAITANDTNDAIKIEVTGIASQNWRWQAVCYFNDLKYA